MNNLQELELTIDFVDAPQTFNLKDLGLEELNEIEMSEIEGGTSPWLIAAGVVGIGAAGFAAGWGLYVLVK